MEYINGFFNGIWDYLIPIPAGLDYQSATDQSEGSGFGDEYVSDSGPLPDAPAGNDPYGTEAATILSGDQRGLLSGSTEGGLDLDNIPNDRRPESPVRQGSDRDPSPTFATYFTLSPHYYEEAKQALKAHDQSMKRRIEERLEERHDRDFKRPRVGGIFRPKAKEPLVHTMQGEQDFQWKRERAELSHHGDPDYEKPSAQPGQSPPRSPDAAGNVGRGSRVEHQRKAKEKLFRILLNAQQNGRPSQYPTGSPVGGGRSPSRSARGPASARPSLSGSSQLQGRSTAGQRPTSPQVPPKATPALARPSLSGSSQQQGRSTAGQRPTSPQVPPKATPSKPSPPKPSASKPPSPEQRKAKSTQSKPRVGNRELENLKIAGSAKFFGVNYTEKGPPAEPEELGGEKNKSPSPPRQAGSKPVASPPKPKRTKKEPPSKRGPRRPSDTFNVQVTEETTEWLTNFENWNWGPETTSGSGLLCLCYAIQQSMQAQYPEDEVLSIRVLRELATDSLDPFSSGLMTGSGEVRIGKNFSFDEARGVVNVLGYHLIIVSNSGPGNIWVWDNSDYIVPGSERYLVLYHEPGHYSSIGPNTQHALRVGGTLAQTLDTTRHVHLRDIIASLIHDPLFDRSVTIEQFYVKINESLPKRLRTAFRRSEIRNCLIRMNGEDLVTAYSEQSGTARRHSEAPAQCRGRGCMCGFVMDIARHEEFRTALAEIIHWKEFNTGLLPKVIMGHINDWYSNLTDRQNIWFDQEETRAGLKALNDDLDLVDWPIGDQLAAIYDDRARRFQGTLATEGIPEQCSGEKCPCRSESSRGKPFARPTRNYPGKGKTPSPRQR